MESLVKLVGSNIKEIRKMKKLTQEELAEKCGLQTSYLAGVERGDRNITIQTLEKITEGLEETPSSIFKFDTINFDNKYFEKKELIMILQNLIKDRSEVEVRLILNIANEIFNTFEK
ncbi:helix-turn-helix domain-containing protein [Lysinibacillus pakistanensis]|uniref:Helix-turn-helix transcriptional regulator n=1 Tax=Lysinibacillus pakistanensis TaxID=759811 RepID=A0AAX3WNT3_9BACI|nr:helix-turn-helix transcriptional regulator [Lysinibacillus pakistanensis]MDM5233712.1 helix-turn-helix transcriptional regulator [Lysinibacillus pakistanensis]WHY44337.1 helix-turn-helix transcriptional regulator [Lysinibacillus pakistanensis]WHY49344.1 helix-turn-helix transcriptional regulator [Lysinibacillus pakistanensis]